MALNAALDACRQHRRVSDLDTDRAPDLESRPDGEGPWDEYREQLARCWHLLSPPQRRLIEARRQNSDYDAVGHDLGIQIGSAYKLFHAARKQLLECAKRNGL